jgi:hypothetical protein
VLKKKLAGLYSPALNLFSDVHRTHYGKERMHMKKRWLMAGLVFASVGMVGAAHAECVLHYERTACKGKDAESFKKCDGKAACDKAVKEATSKEACAAAALKACDNDRLDITKYKKITADMDGKPLVGGFNAVGKADAAGNNFCAADRPDLNKCQ